MTTLKAIGRSAGALCAGFLAALIVFGLALAAAWQISSEQQYKLAAALLAAALGLLAGGWLSGQVAGSRRIVHGGLFGLLFGLFAATYLLGPRWMVLPAFLAAILLGSAGGWLAAKSAGVKVR
jgi:hypothetical protein